MKFKIPIHTVIERRAWLEDEAHLVSTAGIVTAIFATDCGVRSAALDGAGQLVLEGAKGSPFAGFSNHAVAQKTPDPAIARHVWEASPEMGLRMMAAQPRAIYCGNAALSLLAPDVTPPLEKPAIMGSNWDWAYRTLEAFASFLDIGAGTVAALSDSLWAEAEPLVFDNERALREAYLRLKTDGKISAPLPSEAEKAIARWPIGEREASELLEEARASGPERALWEAEEYMST